MAPAIPPTGQLPPRQPPDFRNDYRSMVNAIQSGDLPSAQQAYARVTRGLPASAYDEGTTLGKIGAALEDGNLPSAQSTLDTLETKAMKVLRAVQQVTEADRSSQLPPGTTFRITI
jgi:hypothetical protein